MDGLCAFSLRDARTFCTPLPCSVLVAVFLWTGVMIGRRCGVGALTTSHQTILVISGTTDTACNYHNSISYSAFDWLKVTGRALCFREWKKKVVSEQTRIMIVVIVLGEEVCCWGDGRLDKQVSGWGDR